MEQHFTIVFDFPLEYSAHTVQLTATVQLHHPLPYYTIDAFFFKNSQRENAISVLPKVEIEKLIENGIPSWVHRDSRRSSMLSMALGKAIEEKEKL